MIYNSDRRKQKTCKNLFSFQKLNKYFLLPFFIPIICFSTKFFSETMKTDGGKIKIEKVTSDNTHTFVFLYQIIQSLCLFLGGLVYFITAHESKTRIESSEIETKSNNDSSSNSQDNSLVENFKKKKSLKNQKKDYKKIVIIIFMPFLIIAYNLGIAYGVKHPQLEKRVYFLFFITLINIFIFKKQLFKHQKLALFITFIGIIPIYTSFGLYLNTKEYSILYDILLLIGSLCYSVYLVFIKYLTLNKQMPVFLLLFYQGILCSIYTIIIYCIMSLSLKGDFTYIYNIFHCYESNYLCITHNYIKIIFYFILNIVLQALIFLVVYIFSPELFAISDIWSPLFSCIALWIQERDTNKHPGLEIFLHVFGYLIIAFGAFIYNEIIVCNFCGFNKNTWKAIDQKAYNDLYMKDTKDSFALFDGYNVECTDILREESFFEMTSKHS